MQLLRSGMSHLTVHTGQAVTSAPQCVEQREGAFTVGWLHMRLLLHVQQLDSLPVLALHAQEQLHPVLTPKAMSVCLKQRPIMDGTCWLPNVCVCVGPRGLRAHAVCAARIRRRREASRHY